MVTQVRTTTHGGWVLSLTCLVSVVRDAVDIVVVQCLLDIPVTLRVIVAARVRTHHRLRVAFTVQTNKFHAVLHLHETHVVHDACEHLAIHPFLRLLVLARH